MSTLSVVMTNYNHAKYLDRSLNAICTQSRPPDEFIIQDDCSTDNSLETIQRYADKYSFIKVKKNEKNMGAMLAMEKVIALASMDYLYCSSADDCIEPGFFKTSMEWLDKCPNAGICTGDIRVNNIQLNRTFNIRLGFSHGPIFLEPDHLADLMKGQPIFGHCTIYHREKLAAVGGMVRSLSYMSDWLAALVLSFRYGCIYIPQIFCIATAGINGYAEESCNSWDKKRDAISSFLRLVKTQYRDVLPHFILSAALTNYHQEAMRTVLTSPEFWDIESLLLVQYPLLIQQHAIHKTIIERAQNSQDFLMTYEHVKKPTFLDRLFDKN